MMFRFLCKYLERCCYTQRITEYTVVKQSLSVCQGLAAFKILSLVKHIGGVEEAHFAASSKTKARFNRKGTQAIGASLGIAVFNNSRIPKLKRLQWH